jgi:hypothetical protein
MSRTFLAAAALLVLFSTAARVGAADAPPKKVDVAKQLDRVIPELKMDGVGASDMFALLGDVSGLKIDVDWDALAKAGVEKDGAVKFEKKGLKTRVLLDFIVAHLPKAKAKLGWVATEDGVKISTAAELAKAKKGGK